MSTQEASIKVHLNQVPSKATISKLGASELLEQSIERACATAFQEGQAAGCSDSLSSGRAALESAADRLDNAREAALEQLTAQSIELAVAIAGMVVQQEVTSHNYNMEAIVRGALEQTGAGRGAVTVHVCPEDAERLKDVPFRRGTCITPDPELSRGDVHIDTSRGVLVRDTFGALETIKEQLLEEFAS